MTTTEWAVLAALPADPGRGTSKARDLSRDSLPWPARDFIEARVRGMVAVRWDALPGSVRLDWGAVDAPWVPGQDTRVALEGTGRGGYWVVRFRDDHPDRPDFILRLRAGLVVPTPVAARSLERDESLEEADILWTETLVWGGPDRGRGSGGRVEAGWVTRRVVRRGEPLVPPAVDRPVLVEGGATVEVFWQEGSIALNLEGRALQSGSLGDRVWVRTSTGQRLQGTVDGPGRIVILRGEGAAA